MKCNIDNGYIHIHTSTDEELFISLPVGQLEKLLVYEFERRGHKWMDIVLDRVLKKINIVYAHENINRVIGEIMLQDYTFDVLCFMENNEKKVESEKIKNEKIVCYYHADMDGIASASIVKSVYPHAKFIKVNYGDDWKKEDVKDSVCIVVDFSFPNMKEINKQAKLLCWIDHHQSAKEKNEKLWDSQNIYGFRTTEKSGCELTWAWFSPHEEPPMSIKLIGDRDTWTFNYGDSSKAFHEYISIECKEPNLKLLSNDVDEAIEKGKLLLKKKKEQVIQSFNDGVDTVFFGKEARIINSNSSVSDIGEYCYKNKNYPIAIIWSVRGDKIIFSLRSNSLDVGKMADSYGGGGHKFAAGFEGDLKLLETFYPDL